MIPPQTNKRAVIYCRVSTRDQVEDGNSLVTQEKNCREYAQKNNYDVVEMFIEQGESAKTMFRTELQKLLTYCSNRKNKIAVVIAYKIDRISRNTDDYSQIRLLLKRYGIEIKSTSEYFENTPAGRFMENIISNVAQFDNDVRTERSVGGMREAMREGRYVWRAPLGYENMKVAGKSTIVMDEAAPYVQSVFQELAKDMGTIERVRTEVLNAGLAKIGRKPVSKTHFYNLLKNQAYAGWIIKFGEKHFGTFQAIVEQNLFDQVQQILKWKKRKLSYVGRHPDFPLRRFIRHHSGKLLTGCWAQGRRKKYPYYFFRGKGYNYKKQTVEDAFKSYLDQFKFTPQQYKTFTKAVFEKLVKGNLDQEKLNEQLEKHIQDLKSKQSQLIYKNLEGVIDNSILQQQLALIDKEIRSKTSLLVPVMKPENLSEKTVNVVKDFLLSPSVVWERANIKHKIELQWFYFPEGLYFDGVNCRTSEICNVFKHKKSFSDLLYSKVNLRLSKSNTPEVGNPQNPYRTRRKMYKNPHPVIYKEYTEDKHMSGVASELEYLQKLMNEKPLESEDPF